MGEQKLGRGAALQAGQPLHGAKHRDHGLGVVARFRHDLQPQAVGLLLIAARVAQLILDKCGLGAHGDADACIAPSGGGDQHASQHGGHGGDLGLLGASLAARVVALGQVAELMGEHRDQLRLLVGEGEQPGVDANHAARYREGVEAMAVDQGHEQLTGVDSGMGGESSEQCLDIGLGDGVLPFGGPGAKLA